MLYIFESDGAGGKGISDIFLRAYGDERFARFYCPPPFPPALPPNRVPEIKRYFGSAIGLASNICIDPQQLRQDFPELFSVLIIRNPLSAALCSYHNFLITYAPECWPDTRFAAPEFQNIRSFIEHVRGENYLTRALGCVPDGEPVNGQHFETAKAALRHFDHIVLAEDIRLSLNPLFSRYSDAGNTYGSDPTHALSTIEQYLSYDLLHVSSQDLKEIAEISGFDIALYQQALASAARSFAGDDIPC